MLSSDEPPVVELVDALPDADPPAGLVDGDTGPMNRPSTPSCRSGVQLSEPLRISADSWEQETVSIVLGVAATAIPCGRKAAAPMTTVTAAGRQIRCKNMSGGPPTIVCSRVPTTALASTMVLVVAANRQTEARGCSTPQTRCRATSRDLLGRPCAGRCARECGTGGRGPEAFSEKRVRRSAGGDGLRDGRHRLGDHRRLAGAGAAPADRPRERMPDRERGAEQRGEHRGDERRR